MARRRCSRRSENPTKLARVEPFPPHPFPQTRIVAYRPGALGPEHYERNVKVAATGEVIRGPLVVVGIDEDGEHRALTRAEMRVYTLEQGAEDDIPTLHVRAS